MVRWSFLCFSFPSIGSCPVTRQHWKGTISTFFTLCLQILKYIDKMPPELNSPSSQPFFTGQMLQSLHHLHGTLLDSIK